MLRLELADVKPARRYVVDVHGGDGAITQVHVTAIGPEQAALRARWRIFREGSFPPSVRLAGLWRRTVVRSAEGEPALLDETNPELPEASGCPGRAVAGLERPMAGLRRRQAGFSLIEMALTLAAMGGIGLYLLALQSAQTADVQDKAMAQQMRQVKDATDLYITNNFATVSTAAASGPLSISVATLKTAGALAPSFPATTIFGSTPVVAVRQIAAGQLETLVTASGGNAMTEAEASNIACYFGDDGGGYIPASTPTVAHGCYGSWGPITLANYSGSGVTLAANQVAATSYIANGTIMGPYVSRTSVTGHPEYQQITTGTLDMHNNPVANVNTLSFQGVAQGFEALRMGLVNSLYSGVFPTSVNNGDLKIGRNLQVTPDHLQACTLAITGTVRWNDSTNKGEYCDGAAALWRPFSASSGGTLLRTDIVTAVGTTTVTPPAGATNLRMLLVGGGGWGAPNSGGGGAGFPVLAYVPSSVFQLYSPFTVKIGSSNTAQDYSGWATYESIQGYTMAAGIIAAPGQSAITSNGGGYGAFGATGGGNGGIEQGGDAGGTAGNGDGGGIGAYLPNLSAMATPMSYGAGGCSPWAPWGAASGGGGAGGVVINGHNMHGSDGSDPQGDGWAGCGGNGYGAGGGGGPHDGSAAPGGPGAPGVAVLEWLGLLLEPANDNHELELTAAA